MKLKPDDDVRNSESPIMTLTTEDLDLVCNGKSDLDKPIIAHSDMGHKGKDSQTSLSEESSPQTTEGGRDEVKSEMVQVKTESAPNGECTNNLASKDDDNKDGDENVDALVKGLKECRLAKEDESEINSITKEISDCLDHLSLENNDGKKEKKEANFTRRQEPQEDDESEALESLGQKEEKQSLATGTQESQGRKPTNEEIRMVKLDAPCKEEESETETGALEERGPNGIPVYHNYPRSQTSVQLPQTFDFSVQNGMRQELCGENSWSFVPSTANCDGQYLGGKRGINDLDFDEAAPKFFRPPVDSLLTTVNGYNNLDAPGQPNNNIRSINKVCHRQMSGGTVITNDCSMDLNATGGLDLNGTDFGSLTNHTAPLQQQTERLDSLELQEILNFQNLDSAANDGVLDIEELLVGSDQIPDTQRCLPQNDPNAYQLQPQQQQQNLYHPHQQQQQQHYHQQQQTFAQTADMPLSHDFSMPVQNNLPYPQPQSQMGVGVLNQGGKKACQRPMPMSPPQQPFPLEQERSTRLPLQNGLPSPGRMMTHNAEDLGYISDMSPSHETQFPPTPSPMSVMAHSPDPSGSSPPQQNWSPPPSNQSQDSGIFSPLADYGEQQEDYISPYIDENLTALEDALNVAQEDLGRKLMLGANCPPRTALNIPSTVPQDITISPSLQQSPEPLFKDVPSSAQTGKPVAAVARRPHAKKAVPKATGAEGKSMPGKVNEAPISFNNFLMNQPVTTVGPAGTLVISTAAALSQNSAPIVNSQGKVAIPPTRQKSRMVQGTPVLPCVITTKGITPIIVVPQERPRFTAIAPKAPSKPAESQESAASTGNVKASSPSAPGQNPRDKTTKRSTPSVKDKLNIARRSVAELQRNDLMYSDHEGDTHLHVASVKTDECMIESIMERLVRENLGDMVNAQNIMGQTPLYLAVCENKPEMVEVLVRYGADVKHFAEVTLDNGTREQSAAIHRASSKGEDHLRTLKELLKSPSVDLDQMDSEGHTALHCAILSHGKASFDNKVINSIPIIEALIRAGANPNLQVQKNGKTALMFALETRNLDLIESTFQLIDPVKLATYLRTESFDGITCLRIASSIKSGLSPTNQQRLSKCLKPPHASRFDH